MDLMSQFKGIVENLPDTKHEHTRGSNRDRMAVRAKHLQQVVDMIHERGQATSHEVAKHLGCGRTLAQHYLKELTQAGRIKCLPRRDLMSFNIYQPATGER